MTVFAKATPGTKPKTENVRTIALFYAGVLVVFALTQLFSFDKLYSLFESFWLPGGERFTHLLAAIVVIAEVLALPFLLQMRLSKAMRVLSMAFGWLVPALWLFISLWIMLTVNAIHNVGFLGTVLPLEPGWWAVLFSVALGILSIWASWGMWPFKPRKK